MTKRSDYRKGAIRYEFVSIPLAVLRSAEYIALSDAAKGLLLDLCEQYSGGNNGRLTPAWTVMHRRGWTGKTKLMRAKRELLATSFCIQTRQGKAPQTAEWVGFTWWPLNFDRTMEIDPKAWPHLNFMIVAKAKIDPNQGREKTLSGVPKQYRCKFSGGTKTVPMNLSEMAL